MAGHRPPTVRCPPAPGLATARRLGWAQAAGSPLPPATRLGGRRSPVAGRKPQALRCPLPLGSAAAGRRWLGIGRPPSGALRRPAWRLRVDSGGRRPLILRGSLRRAAGERAGGERIDVEGEQATSGAHRGREQPSTVARRRLGAQLGAHKATLRAAGALTESEATSLAVTLRRDAIHAQTGTQKGQTGGGGSPGPRTARARSRTARRRPRRGPHTPPTAARTSATDEVAAAKPRSRGQRAACGLCPAPGGRQSLPGAGGHRTVGRLCPAPGDRQSPSRAPEGSGRWAVYAQPQTTGGRQTGRRRAPDRRPLMSSHRRPAAAKPSNRGQRGACVPMYGHRRGADAMPSRRGHGLMRPPTSRPSLAGPNVDRSPVSVLLGGSRQSLSFRGGTAGQGWPKAIAQRRDEGAPLRGRPDPEGPWD